ncbi:hypothetical protein I549_2111 [Mycobacterium avium subsp. avium 2285 (R)]|nr:hypothetical protein I549_2111 [Mycobacterium avium subsp. avium 2285 (R)]
MSVAPETTVALQDRFFRELPELAVRWQAETFPELRLLALNEPLATQLGLDTGWLRGPDGLRFLTGNLVPTGAAPVAQAYAGHQFGGFVPRLGDGRALLLGELVDDEGRLRDIHLKGSGATPFARGGDGLAAVGPMLREYVVSEAMHALGVPTTRSLAVVGTGRPVYREATLPGAVLAGWPAVTCGWAASNTPPRPATGTCCAGWPTTRSPATIPAPRTPSSPTWPCSRPSSRPRRR